MGLSDIDRKLLQRCLDRKPGAWEDFVDRFLGLVVHVIHHTAQSRSVRADPRGHRRLGRRSVSDDHSGRLRDVAAFSRREQPGHLPDRRRPAHRRPGTAQAADHDQSGDCRPTRRAGRRHPPVEKRISNREEVERLLEELDSPEAEVVRLYHLEGKSYREISARVGMPENSIGPTLSRAREKMRQARSLE